MIQWAEANWKWIENEDLLINTSFWITLMKMSLCLERTLKKLFFIFLFFIFFCGIVKLICELRHTFFINLQLRHVHLLILRSVATPTSPPLMTQFYGKKINTYQFYLHLFWVMKVHRRCIHTLSELLVSVDDDYCRILIPLQIFSCVRTR